MIAVPTIDDIVADTVHYMRMRYSELLHQERMQRRPVFFDELHDWHRRQFDLVIDLDASPPKAATSPRTQCATQ